MIVKCITNVNKNLHFNQTSKNAAEFHLKKQNENSAHKLLDKIPLLPECNQLLFDYSHNNLNKEAINLFIETYKSSKPIDDSTLSCILKVSGSLEKLFLGRQIHSLSIKLGFTDAVGSNTSLIDLYMRCDKIEDGRRVFDSMEDKNVVAWTALLSGYTKTGLHGSVLDLYVKMQCEGIKPNPFTFASVLKSCASEKEAENGKKVHSLLVKLGYDSTTFVCNSLINMYSKCGLIREAQMIFEGMMHCRDVVSWNAMIAGMVSNGFDLEALKLFYRMRVDNQKITQLSYVTAVKLCANVKDLKLAKQLHCGVVKEGYCQDGNILTALLVVYSKCKEMLDAYKLFSVISQDRSIVSWTAVIGGYIQNGQHDRAISLFVEMMRYGIEPNDFTYSTILTASPRSISPFEIHCHALKSNYLFAPSVGTALLHAYSKLGNTYEAMSVFKRLEKKDIVTWSAMLASYAQAGDSEGAIKLYQKMTRNGIIVPNEFTFSSIINVSASPAASSDQGKQFHAISIKYQYQDAICVSSALLTMYAKKGSIENAQLIFDRQSERDIVSWNSMISGYAQHGYGKKALEIFQKMRKQDIELDGITFIAVIVACTHTGRVEDGQKYFDSMIEDHGISPTMEHYSCMVDLYGRAGKLKKALNLIKMMPFQACATIWRTFLSSCRMHKNMELGELAAKTLIQIQPNHSAGYVLLSNIYATLGKWKERDAIRVLMDERKVKKEAGISWIQIKQKAHSFVASDMSHPLSDQIHMKVEEMMRRVKEKGYKANTEFVLRDVEEEYKEAALAQHSERLAIAYGLIATPIGSPLQIVKNLRVCGDCHNVIKIISETEKREIVVRDSTRFHHFKDGSCSCGDYW